MFFACSVGVRSGVTNTFHISLGFPEPLNFILFLNTEIFPLRGKRGSRKQSWIGQVTKTFKQILVVCYILRLPFIWLLYSVVQQLTVLVEYIDLTMESIGPEIAGSAGPTLMPLVLNNYDFT